MDFEQTAPAKPIVWWVAFADTPGRAWWDIFTRPGFEHCFAFRALCDDVVLIVDPLRRHIETSVKPGLPIDYIRQLEKLGHTIVVVKIIDSAYNRRRGPLLTCASVVGYLLGLDSIAITPYGLYKRLVNHYQGEVLHYGQGSQKRIGWR